MSRSLYLLPHRRASITTARADFPVKEITGICARKPLAARRIGANREQAGSTKRPDLTSSSDAPKRPGPSGWVLASTDPQGPTETWTHEETGLIAISSTAASPADGRPGYRLALSRRDGGRCGAAQAFMALADFGLMNAQEIETADRSARVFRLASAQG